MAAQFSTRSLTVLADALRKWQAQQAAEAANRQRTALVLGVEPETVTQPFELIDNRAVGAALH